MPPGPIEQSRIGTKIIRRAKWRTYKDQHNKEAIWHTQTWVGSGEQQVCQEENPTQNKDNMQNIAESS